jgi:putative holliday junction resolvase
MGKILAIDYGTKNIGLAISDDEQKVSLPWQTIELSRGQTQEKKIIADLTKLAKLENIAGFLIGQPLTAAGSPTKLGEKIFTFAKNLERETGVPVEVMDERFTSKLAETLPYKTARNIHELSAQILLQDYLDKQKV